MSFIILHCHVDDQMKIIFDTNYNSENSSYTLQSSIHLAL